MPTSLAKPGWVGIPAGKIAEKRSVVAACPLTYNGAGILAMRPAFYLAMAFLALACWSQVAAKKRVAVFDFENAAVEASISSTYFHTS
jgi:hypothetical protein